MDISHTLCSVVAYLFSRYSAWCLLYTLTQNWCCVSVCNSLFLFFNFYAGLLFHLATLSHSPDQKRAAVMGLLQELPPIFVQNFWPCDLWIFSCLSSRLFSPSCTARPGFYSRIMEATVLMNLKCSRFFLFVSFVLPWSVSCHNLVSELFRQYFPSHVIALIWTMSSECLNKQVCAFPNHVKSF